MQDSTKEQECIESAIVFMKQAAKAVSERRFEDYFDLVDSFDLEVEYLDEMSVEGGCEYWAQHAREFASLYYLHAMNFFYGALIKITRKEADEQTIDDAAAIIAVMLEQSELFAEHIDGTTKEDLKFYSQTYKRLTDHLDEMYNAYYGKSLP